MGRSIARAKPGPNNAIFDCKVNLICSRLVILMSFHVFRSVFEIHVRLFGSWKDNEVSGFFVFSK